MTKEKKEEKKLLKEKRSSKLKSVKKEEFEVYAY